MKIRTLLVDRFTTELEQSEKKIHTFFMFRANLMSHCPIIGAGIGSVCFRVRNDMGDESVFLPNSKNSNCIKSTITAHIGHT